MTLDPSAPLAVLVHGCSSSGGRFRALAQVFEAHGQQTICFNYDDRDSLEDASGQLRDALQTLEQVIDPQQVTVLAHSQGGLIARRAFIQDRETPLAVSEGFGYRLMTVAAPFGGIASSANCGKVWLHVLTLGMTLAVCHGIAGDKWPQIHPDSGFINEPGTLVSEVGSYLKIDTDERSTCRTYGEDGQCVEDDYVFSLDEQSSGPVETDLRAEVVRLQAGHVEAVGTEGVIPAKLIAILQERGILAQTPPERREAIAQLLRDLY